MHDSASASPMLNEEEPNSVAATDPSRLHFLNYEESDLCCCEYINVKGERSHILGICCDCDTLDDSFERLIQRQNIPESHVHEICSELTDRLRIPWCGGARKINLLSVAPLALLPSLGYLAAMGPFSTLISFLLIPIILRVLSKYNGNKRTPFHYSLSICSLVNSFMVVYMTNRWSNAWLINTFNVFLFVSIFIGMGTTKWKAGKDASLMLDNLPFYYYCRKCQFYINGRDHHCNWIDCCVGRRNRSWFMLTLCFAIVWILVIVYSYFDSLQVKLSTDSIYKDFSSAISFVTALYGMLILLFLIAILTHQLSMTWKGVSYLDWKFQKNLK